MLLRAKVQAGLVAACCIAGPAASADFTHFDATALKDPECVADPSLSFVADNADRASARHPLLPVDRYYLVVRHLGDAAVSAAPKFDFSRVPDSYGLAAARGLPLTNLVVPDPKEVWQRARSTNADLDSSSAFQLHCYDAGSFLNTWTFAHRSVNGGGPHAIYGYTFGNPPPPAVFDNNPQTEFVLQASIEVPWFVAWADSTAASQPVGQVSLFAYFRDRSTGKTFALVLAVFDNRFVSNPTYASIVAHDGETPFVSMPLNRDAAYATQAPYSAAFTGSPWTGLRFFRARITQDNFRDAVTAIDAYCRSHASQPQCDTIDDPSTAFSASVSDYELTEFGVLHEVFVGATDNLSMGVHIHDLGAWNFR